MKKRDIIYEDDLELNESYNIRVVKDIYNRLEEDTLIFNQKSKNELLNKIILTYLEIKNNDDLSEILYREIINNTGIGQIKDLKKLHSILKTKIYKTTILKPKSDTKLLNFRLNKEALLECRKLKQNSKYFNTEFFRSIFEWYTQKPKFQRERILFHEQLQVLEDAIKNQYEVLLENKNLDKVSCYKPVGIFSTKDENFNYLLTIGKKENSDKEMIYPTRLSNILSARANELEKFDISEKLKEKIDEKLEFKNYTWSEIENIKIKMTQMGYTKYNIVQHLRPNYESKDLLENNEYILEFREATDIIFYYFTQFGGEIEILEPLELREKFENFYRNALKKYEKTF